MVIHPAGPGPAFRICHGGTPGEPWWARPHCPSCTCLRSPVRLEHGTWVTCGACGEAGILPDEGRERDFLPDGVTITGGT